VSGTSPEPPWIRPHRRGPASGARAALALGAVLLAVAAARRPATPAAEGPGPERPWSVQMHLHGPASEGTGSLDTHSREAELLGVDVLWWSGHD